MLYIYLSQNIESQYAGARRYYLLGVCAANWHD